MNEQGRNLALLQSEYQEMDAESCVFAEMWKLTFPATRRCICKALNSSNLKYSVFSICVFAAACRYSQWIGSAAFYSAAATDHAQGGEAWCFFPT